MNVNDINFPYYFYPNIPFSGYMNTKEYNKNLIDLNKLLLNLKSIQKQILLHITIGAPAEEIIAESTDYAWNKQWIQLYSSHLNKNNIEIIHIIIAPNKHFTSDLNYCEYKTPTFIKMTDDLEWEKHKNVYISKIRPITVYIFYTMMPTIDERNNKIIKCNTGRFENIYKSCTVVVSQYLIETYVQTQNDINFTKQFYQNLKELVNIIKENGGITTCFSLAVFCEMTDKFSHGQNYNMFKEITFVGLDLLAEWNFSVDNYKLFEYYNKKIISYNDDSISIIKDNNKLNLQCKFVDQYKNKKT